MTISSPDVSVHKTDHIDSTGVAKRCSHCGVFQARSAFWVKRETKDGRQAWCKVCVSGKGEREPMDPFAPYLGDTHKRCGGKLLPYSADFDGIVMSCSECRLAGLIV